ncbi:MAG TPA: TylF/MycF/NovP-related O-methyltransferase [Pyrinomonadaceae bacterium]
MYRFILKAYYVLTVPIAIYFILASDRIHPEYRLGFFRKMLLGTRMFLNKLRIPTGTSYKTHLAMALKIFETPPDIEGIVLECGTWKGGSAVNLSLACKIAGRKLHIYDSFKGLPEGESGDREAPGYKAGDYAGSLEEVKRNITKYGDIDSCVFVQGWFDQTLPENLKEGVLLAFLDVDLEASLETCVRNIWPRLIDKGYIFIDEPVGVDYCSIFYSEEYWKRYFDRTPPGLIGAGLGLALGEYYIGPWSEIDEHPLQHANSGAYTRKDLSGHWTYYPDSTVEN